MTRRLLLLIAAVLALITLAAGSFLAPAKAAPAPVQTKASTPFCMGGLPIHAVCLTL